ncbi:MAG TPA: adenylosuccinate synthase [Planctomycetaceae bacterium]|nr:adenylosuccinate synthase [Planctomycetaceae bacterium]
MSATAVIGLQWGDEAKGKIVDLLTDQHDIVVRYQGGHNAGHTVVCNGETYKLSLLPVGLLRPGIVSVIATGVVINPQALLGEIDQLRARQIHVGENLLISDRAHVIFPYHVAEEAVLEESRGDDAIGTTRRGIGTCYRDKAGRTHAIRMGDLYHVDSFGARLNDIVAQKNMLLRALSPAFAPLDAGKIAKEYLGYARALETHVTDTTSYLHRALAAGKRLLFEGAQGSLLDLDHGTFPYVTSSSSSGCGIHSGSGVPERNLSRMIGVIKAYTTRVGGGPFPTELKNEVGEHIRTVGREFGTVTGRPRRCGWFDAVAAGYGARISGIDGLAVMLLDVLGQLDEINICTAYEIGGTRTADFPSHVEDLARARPVYRTLPGWKCDISQVRSLAGFPKQTRAYLDALSELIGKPIEIISVGPDREQTVFCSKC